MIANEITPAAGNNSHFGESPPVAFIPVSEVFLIQVLNPIGLADCQHHESSHIVAISISAAHPSSSLANDESA